MKTGAEEQGRTGGGETCDQPGVIDHERLCVGCGYDLRGLGEGALCPECGTPAGRSLRGGLLVYAAPDYVNRLRLGANWMMGAVYGVLGALLLFIAGITASMFLPFPMDIAMTVNTAVLIAAAAGAVVGVFLLTTPSPAEAEGDGLRLPRRGARLLSAAGVGLVLLSTAVHILSPGLWGPGGVGRVLKVTVLVALGGAVFSLMHYIRRLAMRIPDREIAKQAGHVLLLGLGVLAAQITYGAGVISAITPAGPKELAVKVVSLIVTFMAGFGTLYWLGACVYFVHTLRDALARVWRQNRALRAA